MSKAKRRLKAKKREAEYRAKHYFSDQAERECPHCKQTTRSGHLIPPSLGDPGIWICDPPK